MIIEAIKYCHKNSDGESCQQCPAWKEKIYICKNVRNMGEDFAILLVEEFERIGGVKMNNILVTKFS